MTTNHHNGASNRRRVLSALCVGAWILGAGPLPAVADPAQINIRFDDTAVRQLIALIKAKDTTDASLDRWLDLPANRYILKTGEAEQDLTRAQFKQDAIAVISGTATAASEPPDDIGCLYMSSIDEFSHMLDQLEATEKERIARIVARDTAYAPDGVVVDETVYVHVGGDWDAVNDNGNIYLNMRMWHDGRRRSWDGLNMIIAHETMHSIQTAAYGNPQDESDGPGAFFTTLSKIQREGTARYVEYDADPEAYQPYTYGFFERALDTEGYRSFHQEVALMEPVYAACYPVFDYNKFVQAYETGMSNGGPFYDVGYGIARAIDERFGRRVFIDTVTKGPKNFYSQYVALCAIDSSLPKLPVDIVKAVAEMPDRLAP